MNTKKQDLFGLENDSENEVSAHSSDEEEQQDSRFSAARLQAFSSDEEGSDASDNDEDNDDNDDNEGNEKDDQALENSKKEQEEDIDRDFEDDEGYDAPKDLSEFGIEEKKKSKKSKKVKSLTPEELEKFEKARKKTGVCYLSRIPLFMKPGQLRTHLAKYADIGRIYLVPEDPKITARRKKYTKNRRTNFIEGWVEFKDKKIAKSLAEYLNMRQIGGKRKSMFYHETWNIKYLPKFKWNHLTEHMAHERQARQQRLRNEIAQSNRENKAYIQNVEKAKMLQSMEEKKRKRQGSEQEQEEPKIKRTFAQRSKVEREVDPSRSGKESIQKMDHQLKGVLTNLFAKK
ncbi:uncharacterized protein B0P05DRAFT_559593 [Gilbertella persicaria]|uniref:uncharacterized protein n=1 Tax=Gilbertella persicaria TaxID=101096 RepID=UPI0022212199|nr:uncharacterized protein B0P05DRAFT_559593 [Gilbertella persicaria]KAI8057520.1 hypothetical protein B0P05DRAFT_559593 [Gilbertella persicaria]